jgi:hypothetical protein
MSLGLEKEGKKVRERIQVITPNKQVFLGSLTKN